jgi:hypothetical protein
MEDQSERRERRVMTPAVLASALFVAACATFAISFVAARGGLHLAPGSTPPPVAVATPEPTVLPTQEPSSSPAPLPSPEPSPSTEPTVIPSLEPTPIPSVAPTTTPSEPPFALPPIKAGDPLRALDRCPDHPVCFIYVVQRQDTWIRILNRYDVKDEVIRALNPKLKDPSLIVVGQTLYLGRDRFARLDLCPNGERCALYTVMKGDSVGIIAARYAITEAAIEAANPTMPHPIVPGLVLKLPYPG